MTEDDPRQELHALVRAFRQTLDWHERAGRFAVSAQKSMQASMPASPQTSRQASMTAPFGMAPTDQDASSAAEGEDAGPTAMNELSEMAAEWLRNADSPPRASPSRARIPAASERPDERPGEKAALPAGEKAALLAKVRADLGDCQRCKLCRGRQHIVFGDGSPTAALLFVGEAPGMQEDRIGLPFVGSAGQLLDRMIAAMGWSRETVYITNIIKCRPPDNRDPEPDEIESCRPFLARQIEIIEPRLLVTLGRPAAHLLLGTDAPMHALRGRFQTYRGIKVMPTFHPAYLLRNPDSKRDTWNDLKQVIAELARLGIDPPFSPRS